MVREGARGWRQGGPGRLETGRQTRPVLGGLSGEAPPSLFLPCRAAEKQASHGRRVTACFPERPVAPELLKQTWQMSTAGRKQVPSEPGGWVQAAS